MPNIQPLEVVIVSAGFLVLCIVPALVAWSDALARRRAHAALVQLQAVPIETLEFAQNESALPNEAVGAVPFSAAPSDDTAGGATAFAERSAPSSDLAAPAEPSLASSPIESVIPIPEAQRDVASEPHQAVTAGPTYEFRLLDLRRARLLDWPPPAVRDDSERYRAWQEGARLAAQYQDRIDTAVLKGPYLPQSACLRGADIDRGTVRVRYFVFRDLWPVAESQAAGEAVFEVDTGGTEVRARFENHASA